LNPNKSLRGLSWPFGLNAVYQRQDSDGDTPNVTASRRGNQSRQLRAFAESQSWTVVDEYVDRLSSKTADRDQFQNMFQAASIRSLPRRRANPCAPPCRARECTPRGVSSDHAPRCRISLHTHAARRASRFTIGSAFSELRQRGVHAPVFIGPAQARSGIPPDNIAAA
jgi:hypothetical protein